VEPDVSGLTMHDDEAELWSVFEDLSFEDAAAADITTAPYIHPPTATNHRSISPQTTRTLPSQSTISTTAMPSSPTSPRHIHITQTIHVHEPTTSQPLDVLSGGIPMGEELRAALVLLTADIAVFEVVSDMIRFYGEVETDQWPQVLRTCGFEDTDITRLVTLMQNDPTRLHERAMRAWRRQKMMLASHEDH
jgi:hypothetical protein